MYFRTFFSFSQNISFAVIKKYQLFITSIYILKENNYYYNIITSLTYFVLKALKQLRNGGKLDVNIYVYSFVIRSFYVKMLIRIVRILRHYSYT